jgi:hypothetical protein
VPLQSSFAPNCPASHRGVVGLQFQPERALSGGDDHNYRGGCVGERVRIKAWNYVTFVNSDSRPHAIASDPVDLHTQCPPLNRVGLLQPGESRDTGTLNLPGVCGFHDHNNTSDIGLQGRIVVE